MSEENCAGGFSQALHRPMGKGISVLESLAVRNLKRQKGQNLVELAIGLSVLLIIAFGVMDLARVFHSIIVITNAAREGARYATRFPNDIGGAEDAAINEAQGAGLTLDPAKVNASCPPGANGWCESGEPATVTISHTFETVFGTLFSASPVEITRFAQMMVP